MELFTTTKSRDRMVWFSSSVTRNELIRMKNFEMLCAVSVSHLLIFGLTVNMSLSGVLDPISCHTFHPFICIMFLFLYKHIKIDSHLKILIFFNSGNFLCVFKFRKKFKLNFWFRKHFLKSLKLPLEIWEFESQFKQINWVWRTIVNKTNFVLDGYIYSSTILFRTSFP